MDLFTCPPLMVFLIISRVFHQRGWSMFPIMHKYLDRCRYLYTRISVNRSSWCDQIWREWLMVSMFYFVILSLLVCFVKKSTKAHIITWIFYNLRIISIREADPCLPSCISILIGADICILEYQLTGLHGVTRNGVNLVVWPEMEWITKQCIHIFYVLSSNIIIIILFVL